VANSTAVKEHLTGRGIAEAKINVIYNGLDLDKFANAAADGIREQYGLPSDVSIVTLVANLRHDVKNVPMLLRAAKRLGDTKAHFVIAGEGELEGYLRAQAAELGIKERVHFIGRCTDVPSLLATSDICVLTSKAEGFSSSILEYMAAGKPVVATNVGGAAEVIVDGSSGFTIESDDDAALAERLKGLLDDKVLAGHLGDEAKRTVSERFSFARQLNETKDLYNSILSDKR
jgi:glycosyltransferase involved in cell wall biosynthesis